MEEVALVEAQLLSVIWIWMVVVQRLDHLWIAGVHQYLARILWQDSPSALRLFASAHTFFGGWIAIADLGVMELCRLGCLEVSFSPLIERRMALAERLRVSATLASSPDVAENLRAQQSRRRDDTPSWPAGDCGDNDFGRRCWRSVSLGFVRSR